MQDADSLNDEFSLRLRSTESINTGARYRGTAIDDDPLPSVSLSTPALTIDEGMTQTVAIIAEGALADAVMRVGVQVTGDALISLWQDGDQLAARGGVTYVVDLGDSTSTVLTITVRGSTAVPALPLVGQLVLALLLMAVAGRLLRRGHGATLLY